MSTIILSSGEASRFALAADRRTPVNPQLAPAVSPTSQVVYRVVTDADPQFHYTNRVTPIQSRAFDTGISVAIRNQADVLGAPMLSRQTNRKIREQFADYNHLNLGDVLDTSNLPEYVMYLLSNFTMEQVRMVLELPSNVSAWIESEWTDFFARADVSTWQQYFDRIIALMAEGKLNDTPLRPAGNHDGALVGNGIELSFTKGELNRQIKLYERKLRDVQKEEDRISSGQRALFTIGTSEEQNQILQARRYAYERKLTELRHEAAELKQNGKGAEAAFGKKTFLLPGSLIRIAFGLGMFGKLRDEDGYWAQNAGGVENIVDKKKYLAGYLQEQYPEIKLISLPEDRGHAAHAGHVESEQGAFARFHEADEEGHHEHNHPTIEPFAAKLHYHDIGFDLFRDPFDLEHVPLTGEPGSFATNDDGFYVKESLSMNASTSVHDRFSALWKEVRPGEWTCVVDVPFAPDSNSTQHYITLQARQDEDVNGNKVFHFLLDNMDNTMEKIQIAFFGGMSRLQRELLELFQREMRLRHDFKTLFLHSGHFPLSRVSKAYWEQFGWDTYFEQPDVVPIALAGHEHDRGLVDENKRHFFGFETKCIGKRTTQRDGGFHSFVAPSTTDDPNEFMSTEISYDSSTGKYTATQRFHKVIAEDEIEKILEGDKEFSESHPQTLSIAQALINLAPWIEQHHYQEYAIDGNFLRQVRKLFSSPDHIKAYDAIPIAIGQFRESILFTEYTLRILREEFGVEYDLVKMYERTLHQLQDHLSRFMEGDPFAENPFDRMGWNEALVRAKKMRSRDADEFLANFDDVFDSPAYDILQFMQNLIPEGSRAFNFWVLLARQAADNEKSDDPVFLGFGGLSDLPDVNQVEFEMASPATAGPRIIVPRSLSE